MNGKTLTIVVVIAVIISSIGLVLGKDAIMGFFDGDIELTDDRNVTVRFDGSFSRIASMGEPFTQILGELDALDKVVLVDKYGIALNTTYPQIDGILDVNQSINGDRNLIAESIILAAPDIVITYYWPSMSNAMANIAFIEDTLKIPVLAYSPSSYDDVMTLVNNMGIITGKVDNATAIFNQMSHVKQVIQDYVSTLNESDYPHVYFELATYGMKTVNYGSVSHNLIVMAGGINVAADSSISASSYPTDQEDLVDFNSTYGIDMVIIEERSTREDSYFNTPLPGVPIHRFPYGLNSYNTMLMDGLIWMAETLYPEVDFDF